MNSPDRLIVHFDRFLRTVAAPGAVLPQRSLSLPAELETMSDAERTHSAGLMRVNHAGEVAAQALYDAQAMFAKTPEMRAQLEAAGREERDHLAWTQSRLDELRAPTSMLNPLWYAGAFALGAACAVAGDKTSASFLKATENQVESHLTGHLASLPAADLRSRAVVEAMRADEAAHAKTAESMGAQEFPKFAQALMGAASKVMTTLAYKI